METERPPSRRYSAVILNGGRSRRMGGTDKLALDVGGRTLEGRVLDAVADAGRVVMAGRGERASTVGDRVAYVQEEPPGGGPLAGLGAAMPLVTDPVFVLLAGDLPFVAGVPRLLVERLTASPTADAVIPLDDEGKRQPLTAAYRTEAVRAALDGLRPLTGRPMGDLLARLTVAHVPAAALPDLATADIDTPAAYEWAVRETARRAGRRGGTAMEDWAQALAKELGISADVDVPLLLDVAREAAHAVARPAAPLTTYLVGYAAALDGGSPEAVTKAADTARLLAQRWEAEQQ